jgi:hypothetical protein
MSAAQQQWPCYRDMTPEQMLAWGIAERKARMADLEVRGAEGLRQAQANCEVRRKSIGASKSAAASMVLDASRQERRAAMAAITGSPS